jgi:GNAT superfamily N-acetyltransferase
MLAINPLQEADLPGALRLSTQAGWNQIDADWRRLLTLWPDTCLAGRLENQLVATATLATYGDVGWVGMVLVDQSHRRRGYGGQMFDAVLDLGRARGVRVFGLDATDAGRPVYLRRGFVDAVGIDRWRRAPSPLHEIPIPDDRRGQFEHADLDLRAFGVDRGRMLARLAVEPGVRSVTLGGDAFALVRPGRTCDHVGPVIASSEQAAETVVTAALGRVSPGRGALMDVPHGRFAEFLPRHGFEPVRRLVRMQTGATSAAWTPLLAGPGVFAACGFELG